MSRSHLILQNLSNGPLWFEFGSARASATITNGVVTSVTVTNAGFNFTRAPKVLFMGGGGGDGSGGQYAGSGNTSYVGLGQPNGWAPSNPAKGRAIMTGSAPNQSVASIAVDSGGSNYLCAPYVFLHDDRLDPNGVAVPSAGIGLMLTANSPPYVVNGSTCTTDAIAVFGATAGQGFLCKWMD